jgi:hypothetical protein
MDTNVSVKLLAAATTAFQSFYEVPATSLQLSVVLLTSRHVKVRYRISAFWDMVYAYVVPTVSNVPSSLKAKQVLTPFEP